MGPEREPVTLDELYEAFQERYPDIHEGWRRQRFVGTVQRHCVNIRARFPKPDEPFSPARWMTQPLFKRVDRKRYQLLSAAERECVFRRLTACDLLMFRDDYGADEVLEE